MKTNFKSVGSSGPGGGAFGSGGNVDGDVPRSGAGGGGGGGGVSVTGEAGGGGAPAAIAAGSSPAASRINFVLN